MKDEQRPIQSVYDGDPASLDLMAARYEDYLRGFCEKFLGDPALAEEAMDNVWATVFLGLRDASCRHDPGRGPFLAWLIALTGHRAWLLLR